MPSVAAGPAAPESTIPAQRTDAIAVMRHLQDLQQVAQRNADVVFLGDSITDFWGDETRPGAGHKVWMRSIAPLDAVNFGVSGDLTQHVLWRIADGELADRPRVVVLEIGTNNLGSGDSVDETIAGIEAVVAAVRKASPRSQILLMGILPRGGGITDPLTQQAYAVNASIAELADGFRIRYLDIGSAFLNPDGTVSQALLPDGLHPSEEGYEVWADAIARPLRRMLARAGVPVRPIPGRDSDSANQGPRHRPRADPSS